MPRYDFRSPRLFVDEPFAAGARIPLGFTPLHYLRHVLRLKPGNPVLVFNGRDGEWKAEFVESGRRGATLTLLQQTRSQTRAGDVHYLFAPLKRARLDYLVQKAVEMGASRLLPVVTQHTQAERVNIERMRANAVEAAEQCGIMTVPEVADPVGFEQAITALDPARRLVFCDEDAPVADPIAALAAAKAGGLTAPPLAVLIGPEGGFAESERAALVQREGVIRLALGPRILRADTAAVAALALVQVVLGDWA